MAITKDDIEGLPEFFIEKYGLRSMRKLKTPIIDRAMKYVSPEPNTGCWLWSGHFFHTGYGSFCINRDHPGIAAHKAMYEIMVGPIPDGLELDHLCRVHACVNPDHLDPVTHQVNVDRGLGAKGHTKSEAHRLKIRASNLGNTPSENTRRAVALANAARIHSPETRAKLRIAAQKANAKRWGCRSQKTI